MSSINRIDNIFYVIVDKSKLKSISPSKGLSINLKEIVENNNILLFMTLSPTLKMLKRKKSLQDVSVIQVEKENSNYIFLSKMNMKTLSFMIK